MPFTSTAKLSKSNLQASIETCPATQLATCICLSFVFVAQGSGNLPGVVFRVNRVGKIFYFVFDSVFTSPSTRTAGQFSQPAASQLSARFIARVERCFRAGVLTSGVEYTELEFFHKGVVAATRKVAPFLCSINAQLRR